MARIVDSLPPDVRGAAAFKPKYPYDNWFNGQVWELKHGEDFNTKKVEHFVQTMYQYAKKHGVRITIRVRGELVYLQRTGYRPING